MRKYTFNINYFKNIDTEEKAYWLGFITADGYLNKKGNTVGICLKANDNNHLKKFKKSINFTGEIFYRKSRFSKDYPLTEKAVIEIYSTELSKDLNKLGLTYTKSKSLSFVNNIPPKLFRHFFRGWMDGDGHVHMSSKKAKQKKYSFGAVGTEDFLKFILNNIPFKTNIYKDKRTTGTFEMQLIGKEKFLLVYDYLYKDSTIYLERKFKKATEILKLIK